MNWLEMRAGAMRLSIFVLLTASFGSIPPATAAPCTLAALHWMEGSWRRANDTTQVEERWVIGPDDRLIGSSWLLHAGKPGGVIEAMTITANGDEIALRIRHFDATLEHAREDKDLPMLFVAADCDENTVRFEGRGDRTGERISYRRDGDKLNFVGEFIHGGERIRVEEIFTR
jgi:hypothetical protein